MKTAGRENPNRRGRLRTEPSPWGGKSESSSLIHTGWKVRKHPALGVVFFLTFSFIEPSPWGGKSESSSLIHTGWKVRKHPALGEVFFLTFSFIELHRAWAVCQRSGWKISSCHI
jgi:hypothetical protein